MIPRRSKLVLAGVLFLLAFLVSLVLTYAGDSCYQEREVLCGKAREAADMLRETNQARAVLEEAIRLARCE